MDWIGKEKSNKELECWECVNTCTHMLQSYFNVTAELGKMISCLERALLITSFAQQKRFLISKISDPTIVGFHPC
ncbi:hypothetical protein JHK87_052003 [Glycine soja]|nr:hypothetical protein JHK87_052003 [Glycine soja]